MICGCDSILSPQQCEREPSPPLETYHQERLRVLFAESANSPPQPIAASTNHQTASHTLEPIAPILLKPPPRSRHRLPQPRAAHVGLRTPTPPGNPGPALSAPLYPALAVSGRTARRPRRPRPHPHRRSHPRARRRPRLHHRLTRRSPIHPAHHQAERTWAERLRRQGRQPDPRFC